MSPTVPTVPIVGPKRLRATLAAAQVSHSAFARAAGLHRVYLGGILTGRVHPGELATIRIARALAALGLYRRGVNG
jgi:hypothetical protein